MTNDKQPPPLPSGLVTFMFTDIVGSTQMKGKMPGETSSERETAFVQRIKDPHGAIVAECVKARGGFIIKSTGDGFLIAFADAEKAVLCAVEIQERLNAAAIFTPDGPLQIRIGLNSGHAKPTNGDYTASAVDKAARVESKAGHEQVYLSRETYAVVRDKVRNISITSVGSHDMKGVGDEELFVAVRAGQTLPQVTRAPSRPKHSPIPKAPAFFAEPPYIGSHEFVGRKAELERLSDWAASADSHPILLFEAIGGAGKSMLTWEWTRKHAINVRGDWAGSFWYSFYEKGAIMADFCQRALAYIMEKPLEEFRKKKTAELGELLLHHLLAHPWLLVLDGLERVLVAYHRIDAAQVADEEAGTTDQIARRDPCAAIRPEDDDLLRTLAAAAPSKLLITTRLTPRVLLNPSSQGIQGVLRVPLPGLRPADAERLLVACGVTGVSREIQNYLKSHCDCHPLVTGVLAGLISDYFPNRGNFDAWAADVEHGGGQLNLANLDLVQKRNNILHAALAALSEKSRQLLSTLALLSEAVDYETLRALNPHLPPEPEKVSEPERPQDHWRWGMMPDDVKERMQKDYEVALERRKEYEEAFQVRLQSAEFTAAPQELVKTVRDLERRGLLQYDAHLKRYDLHPVVRGIAAGGLLQDEKEQYGQRVVDHFSQKAHSPYGEAETLDDIRNGLQVVRTLLQMGRYQQAYETYRADLNQALNFNLEAYAEVLSLLRPFFPQGWAILPASVDEKAAADLVSHAASLLHNTGEFEGALVAYGAALLARLQRENWYSDLSSIALTLSRQNRLAMAERYFRFAIDVVTLSGNQEELFVTRRNLFWQLAEFGLREDAEAMWQLLDPMGRNWARPRYRQGNAEFVYALFRFWQGDLGEEHLAQAEQLARAGRSRSTIRSLHRLRGEWQLEQCQWSLAADSFREAVRMAREVGQADAKAEAQLALAKFHLNQLPDPRHAAEQLASAKNPSHRVQADLWLAIGDAEQAKKHAIAAYEWAWADGEPYVHRYELNKARALLERLGAEIPKLPPYDPAKDEEFPWEDEVVAAIDKLRAEKETEKRREEKKLKEELNHKKSKGSAPKKGLRTKR